MLSKPFLPTILAVMLSGCASDSTQPHGNPFDESAQAPSLPASTRTAAPKLVASNKIGSGQISNQAPIVSTAPVLAPLVLSTPSDYAANAPSVEAAQNTLHSTTPISQLTSAPQSEGDAIYAEAMRLGDAGDNASKVGLLEQAGLYGSGDALYELAKLYQQGTVVARDEQRSVLSLTSAQGYGHVESGRVLGMLYLRGQGVEKDVEYGKLLLDEAAITSVRAMREYGQLLTNQRQPYLNDSPKGQALLRKAVALGDAQSAMILSSSLEQQGDTAGAAAIRLTAQSLGFQPSDSTPVARPVSSGAKADLSAEAMKLRAFSGDIEAVYQYALKVSTMVYPSVEPEFEAYCWYSAAAALGLAKANQEVRALSGVHKQQELKNPGRVAECISSVVESVSQ